VARLAKRDAELLIDALDSPLLIDALRAALQRVLDVEGFPDDWGALVRLAGERGLWTPDRVTALVERETSALVDLATELSELRQI
jgi:hypothetical protein